MTLALLDAPTGLAGNMLLAALLDLGLPREVIEHPLAVLGLAEQVQLQIEERRSAGFRGLHLAVESTVEQPSHRRWGELRGLLEQSGLEPPLKQKALEVFGLLAEAEAAVHGHPPEEVHFHEVGALDALVDVLGVCAGLLHFGIERLHCSVPPAGHGTVHTAHGLLPLPAPAVLEIASRRGIPLRSSADFPPGELTTPTGLALVACWCESFGPPPDHRPRRIGIGLGSRRLDRPNLLRLCLGEEISPAGRSGDAQEPMLETLWQQQAQIDDATAEEIAFLVEALRQAGAREVFSQAISMKKGRSGTLVTALVSPEQRQATLAAWWRHGSSLGVREQQQHRWVLPRETFTLNTPLGPVRIKRSQRPGGAPLQKAEYEDLAALALRHGLSLAEVRARVESALAGSSLLPP
ncbi:MAG: nickel pincer cofactor biosynthesis protein LarC [Prochlorococcaceae cyanobacterium]|jgi:uncharacterized protein (TIGR00299 family) protein